MKRFALLFASLVTSIPITGCGVTATGPAAGDANLPSEVKEYEARREAERAKQADKLRNLPGKNLGRRAGALDGSLQEPGAR